MNSLMPNTTFTGESWKYVPVKAIQSALDQSWPTRVLAPIITPTTLPKGLQIKKEKELLAIQVDPGVELHDPIFIHQNYDADTKFRAEPRMTIDIGANAKATVILSHSGKTHPYFCNGVGTVSLGENAQLEWVSTYEVQSEAMQLDHWEVHLRKNSMLNTVAYCASGEIVRLDLIIHFEAEGAACNMAGLSILDNTNSFFVHTAANHHIGHTNSNQLFKNILSGKAKAEYSGLVYVHHDAQKSYSEQMNRNLVLSDDAKTYCRPQLRIYADDVKCAHGATVGQLEEHEMLYLMSRGLPKNQVKRLLMTGFAFEVIQKIQSKSAREFLVNKVDAALNKLSSNIPSSGGVPQSGGVG